jgi:hypothetical protein
MFPGNFSQDLEFLSSRTSVVVLEARDNPNAKAIVAPEYQGRVMTTTADAPDGRSYGWINRSFIAAGKPDPHFNNYGGEERFWLGPEGGQFGLFFRQGDTFDFENWYTPAPLNDGTMSVFRKDRNMVAMRANMTVVNYVGSVFDLRVEREISMLTRNRIEEIFDIDIPFDIRTVAFESRNEITNVGREQWMDEGGLISIWLLGQFPASANTFVIIPYEPGPEREYGPIVSDDYFAPVPEDRLQIMEQYLVFKADGRYRSKIGLGPYRCLDVLGSIDFDTKVLTIVQFDFGDSPDFVNSLWEFQENPLAGDVINAYNDGPVDQNTPSLGGFYELETSSPAARLAPGGKLKHVQRTFHFEGEIDLLTKISERILDAPLQEVRNALR